MLGHAVSNCGRKFRQLALKGAAVDTQEFRSLGYVTGAIGKNALDMFPFHSRERRYGRWGVFMRRILIQIVVRLEDLLGVGRLTKVVIGA